jgi:hypothetical protein
MDIVPYLKRLKKKSSPFCCPRGAKPFAANPFPEEIAPKPEYPLASRKYFLFKNRHESVGFFIKKSIMEEVISLKERKPSCLKFIPMQVFGNV